MTEIDYYEIVRPKLKLGPLFAPKHELVYELMKVFWNEEEIKILSYFKSADKLNSLKKIAEKSGIPRKEIKKILARSVKNGTISKIGTKYTLKPLIPGIYETYFIRRRDSKENQIKVAKIYHEYINKIFPQQVIKTPFTVFRPLLPYEAKEKLIKIDESVDVESRVFPYELVEKLFNKNDIFVTIPCMCRLVGEYSGDPCKVAPPGLGCLFCGIAAQEMLSMGLGRQLTKEEAIEQIKIAEKAGLVHNTVADTGLASSIFLCHCCSCHCGILGPAKRHRIRTVNPSNYVLKIDKELCTKCETCLKKCQMEAIYHQWPNEPDSSDEYMFVREEFCIGCGVCASNCPKNAIKMVKVRNDDFLKRVKFGNKPLLELFI